MASKRLVAIATRLLTQLRGHYVPIEKTRLGMYEFCDFDDSHEEIDEAVAVAVEELSKDKRFPPLTD